MRTGYNDLTGTKITSFALKNDTTVLGEKMEARVKVFDPDLPLYSVRPGDSPNNDKASSHNPLVTL